MKSKEQIKAFLSDAYAHAKEAYWQLHDNANTGALANKQIAMLHTAQCAASYTAAEAIYQSTPTLYDEAVPELIQQFRQVTNVAMDTCQCFPTELVQLAIELNCLDELMAEHGYEV